MIILERSARRKAAIARVHANIKKFAEHHGEDFVALRGATRSALFAIVRIQPDRAPLEDVRGSFASVAGAIAAAPGGADGTVADALAFAALKQEAAAGTRRREARGLLDEAASALAARLGRGVTRQHDDGRWTFEGDSVPLRDFVALPARALAQAPRNSLRSHVLKQRPASARTGARLEAIVCGAYAVLWPFYATPGRRTVREKRAGVQKLASFPSSLLEDIATIVHYWRDGEFGELTAERVRRVLRAAARGTCDGGGAAHRPLRSLVNP